MSARWVDRLARTGRVDVVAGQVPGVRDRTGLTPAHTDAAAWAVSDDLGTRVGGARAIALTLAAGWGVRLPMLPWRLPGIPWLMDRIYEFVARHRHRLPGTTPWCVANDGACESND